MEDSATFGSSMTGDNFTVVDLVIEATDDDEGIALTNEGGGTMTFYNDSVVLSSTAEGDEDILISDPAYDYVSGYFTITGAIENCDDFGFAFDADGLIAGSIDCGFLSGAGNLEDPSIEFGEEDDDAEMQMDDDMEMQETDDDAIISASGDASGDGSMMSADGDDAVGSDSCETIVETLCTGVLSDRFTVLCSLLEGVPLPALSLTIFAPTDEAFGKLLGLLGVGSAADVDQDTLTSILMFHVSAGMTMVDDLKCGGLLPMIGSGSSRTKCAAPGRTQGEDFIIQKGGGNRKNDIEPTIIFPDIMACNDSVIHVISEVMLPDFFDKV